MRCLEEKARAEADARKDAEQRVSAAEERAAAAERRAAAAEAAAAQARAKDELDYY